MNPIQLFQEVIDPKHQQIVELAIHNLIVGAWDAPRFTHELRRYIERYDDDKQQARINDKPEVHSNVYCISDHSTGLRNRPSYDGIA